MKAKQKHTKKASAPETRTWDSLSKDEQAADVQAHYDRAAKASASQNRGKWIKEKRASGKEYWIWIPDAPEAQQTIERTSEDTLRFERDMARIEVGRVKAQRDELLALIQDMLPIVESVVLDGEPFFEIQERARAAMRSIGRAQMQTSSRER
jgi:hypothetical protein